MKVFFAGDHAGFELKKKLIAYTRSLGHEAEDLGPLSYDPDDDYPDYVIPLARKIAEQTRNKTERSQHGSTSENEARGVMVAGSGEGEIIAANRIPGVRAVLYHGGNMEIIRATREHNDSNVLSLGARFVNEDEAKEALTLWLETPFSHEERHIRRLQKIEQLTDDTG